MSELVKRLKEMSQLSGINIARYKEEILSAADEIGRLEKANEEQKKRTQDCHQSWGNAMRVEIISALRVEDINAKIKEMKPARVEQVTQHCGRDFYIDRPETVCNSWTEWTAVFYWQEDEQ